VSDLANRQNVHDPFCEIAVEEAVRRKKRRCNRSDRRLASAPGAQEQLRTALAPGADRAISLVESLMNLSFAGDLQSLLRPLWIKNSPS